MKTPTAPNEEDDERQLQSIELQNANAILRARLAAIVEASLDAIISKTLEGVIQTWNAGAARLFGYRAEEAVGRSITLIVPPERLDEEQEILARLSRGERIDH